MGILFDAWCRERLTVSAPGREGGLFLAYFPRPSRVFVRLLLRTRFSSGLGALATLLLLVGASRFALCFGSPLRSLALPHDTQVRLPRVRAAVQRGHGHGDARRHLHWAGVLPASQAHGFG